MGALTYQPEGNMDLGDEDLTLLQLAQEAQAVVHGQDTTALNVLARLGGSPHGARPKVLIYFDPKTGSVGTHPFPDGEPWLVKFQAGTEHPEVCAIEFLYATIAQGFAIDRKSAVEGKSVSARVERGGRGIMRNKNKRD